MVRLMAETDEDVDRYVDSLLVQSRQHGENETFIRLTDQVLRPSLKEFNRVTWAGSDREQAREMFLGAFVAFVTGMALHSGTLVVPRDSVPDMLAFYNKFVGCLARQTAYVMNDIYKDSNVEIVAGQVELAGLEVGETKH
jgi:hypothetical protein